MNFAICNELFEGWEFERVCRFLQMTGYTGIELAPFTMPGYGRGMTPAQRAEWRRIASDAGLEVVGLHWLLARVDGVHLTSPDPEVRRRTSEHLAALVELCADLGGSVMVFGSPAQRNRLPGVTGDDALRFAMKTIAGVLPALERTGVSLCVEPLTGDETNFINTCDEAVELIDMIAHPQVVLQLDVKAMSTEATPVPDLIRRFAGRAGHFHANDPNRRGPGFGDVDFVPIFAALRDAGYNRWVSVEVFNYSPDPETVARQSLDYMRECSR